MRGVSTNMVSPTTPTPVIAGLDPPAGPKPLRRGEGPAIQTFGLGLDARIKSGHDGMLGLLGFMTRLRRSELEA